MMQLFGLIMSLEWWDAATTVVYWDFMYIFQSMFEAALNSKKKKKNY